MDFGDGGGASPKTERIVFAERLGAVDHEQDPLLGVEAALDQIGELRGRDGFACASDTLLFTAVPSFRSCGSPATLPSGADRRERRLPGSTSYGTTSIVKLLGSNLIHYRRNAGAAGPGGLPVERWCGVSRAGRLRHPDRPAPPAPAPP